MNEPLGDVRTCDAVLRRAFEVLGKRWNGMIISVLGAGPAGFSELRRAIDGIGDSVLSERLSELSATGLVIRTVAPGPPVSVAYALTPAGRGLLPALDRLRDWAGEHLIDGDKAGGC